MTDNNSKPCCANCENCEDNYCIALSMKYNCEVVCKSLYGDQSNCRYYKPRETELDVDDDD